MIPIFVKFTDLRKPTETSLRKSQYAIYICPSCQKEFECMVHSIKSNNTSKCKSCACSLANYKHGMSKDRLYRIWDKMVRRTTQSSDPHYSDYGKRGVLLYEAWKDFLVFRAWALNNGYKHTLSIDRRDNDKGYNPCNCRWVDQCTQVQNTRLLSVRNTTGYRGIGFNKEINKWHARIMVNKKRIYLGSYSTKKGAAIAYDTYIITNKLEHPTNILEKKEDDKKSKPSS